MRAKTEKTAFQTLLDRVERDFTTKQALAKAIGITPSRYSRVYKGNAYSLNVLNCLKLAQLAQRSAREVLTIAGKANVADLLEALYGGSAIEKELSPVEREAAEVAALWPTVPEEFRGPMRKLLQLESRARLGSNGISHADTTETTRKASAPRHKR